MAQHYSDPSRESDPHALPNIETFQDIMRACPQCGFEMLDDMVDSTAEEPCEECGDGKGYWAPTRKVWFWQACFPGCLPDGEPSGPFDTEAEALADAREG